MNRDNSSSRVGSSAQQKSALRNEPVKRKPTPKILVTDVRTTPKTTPPKSKTSSLIKEMISEKHKSRIRERKGSLSSSNSPYNSINSKRSSYDMITMDKLATQSDIAAANTNRQIHNNYSFRNKPKIRSSKTTEKLVLIPTMEEHFQLNNSTPIKHSANLMKKKTLLNDHEKNAFYKNNHFFTNLDYESGKVDSKMTEIKKNAKRLTAYNICESINLVKISKFLRKKHNITTRLYDECLYCTFTLPLTSNTHSNLQHRELVMNRNEMKDHHYEYYSIDSDNPEQFMKSSNQVLSPSDLKTSNIDIGELFIFNYGCLVLWNFSKDEELRILKMLTDNFNVDLDESIMEIEEYLHIYDDNVHKPVFNNDILQLPKERDHMVKLALSHPIAQSCKVGRFESRIIPILSSVSKLPKRLAIYGKLGMSREKLLKKFGKLFKLRVDVNLSSNVLDKPDFFWNDEPSLDPLYEMGRQYLEIEERVEILNEKGRVFLEFVDVCVDSIAEKTMTRINTLLVIVFCISVIVSILEILVRYFIIKKNKA